MKLKEKLLNTIEDMQIRAIQLNKYIKEYKEYNDYENAMKCDIKYRQLKMIIQELNKLVD
jgi:broad-specificity NMP kinase